MYVNGFTVTVWTSWFTAMEKVQWENTNYCCNPHFKYSLQKHFTHSLYLKSSTNTLRNVYKVSLMPIMIDIYGYNYSEILITTL